MLCPFRFRVNIQPSHQHLTFNRLLISPRDGYTTRLLSEQHSSLDRSFDRNCHSADYSNIFDSADQIENKAFLDEADQRPLCNDILNSIPSPIYCKDCYQSYYFCCYDNLEVDIAS